MSLNILVTGGTGFVGSYIVKQLAHAGYNITVLVRKESQKSKDLQSLGPDIKILYGDLTNLDSLEDSFIGQYLVVHAAAIVSFDPADRKLMFKTNVEGTTNVVNACLSSNVKKLIYISSIAALSDHADQVDHDETIPWDLKTNHSMYTVSKHCAEMEVWRGAAEGLQVGILNPSVILGRWDPDHHSMYLFKMIQGGISFYPDGSTGWVDVRDVAHAVQAYLEKGITDQQFIINGNNESFRQVMFKIAVMLNKKGPSYPLARNVATLSMRIYGWVKRLMGQKHIIQPTAVNSLYKHAHYSNLKSIEFLNLQYHPLEDTIRWILQV